MFFKTVLLFLRLLKAFPKVRSHFWCALSANLAASAAIIGSLILFKGVIDGLLLQATEVTALLKWISLYLALQISGRFLSEYAF